MKKAILLGCWVLCFLPMVWAQEKSEAPVWNVGDKWTFKKPGGDTFTNSVVDTKEDVYILKMGGIQDLSAYDKKTLNLQFIIEPSGREVRSTSPTRKLFDFPISVGKKWTDTTYGAPGRGGGAVVQTTYVHEFKIEGIEEVTTPAGTFKAYRIQYNQTNMSSHKSGWIRFWYSPDAKMWVKREVEKSSFWLNVSWATDAELISYELK